MRVDIDEYDIPRFVPEAPARATLKGQPDEFFPLKFVRIEPYVVPKKSLTGDNTERVDTRVLQVIYAIDTSGKRLFVGQQLDVFIDASRRQRRSSSGKLHSLRLGGCIRRLVEFERAVWPSSFIEVRMDIRYYIDPDSGEPNIYEHEVTEA